MSIHESKSNEQPELHSFFLFFISSVITISLHQKLEPGVIVSVHGHGLGDQPILRFLDILTGSQSSSGRPDRFLPSMLQRRGSLRLQG